MTNAFQANPLIVSTFSLSSPFVHFGCFLGLPLPIVVVWAVVKAKWHFLPNASDGHVNIPLHFITRFAYLPRTTRVETMYSAVELLTQIS